MTVTIVGGYGQIARLMYPMFQENGHQCRGIIRDENQSQALTELGVEPVVCDIEKVNDISDAVGKVDAVVFAAGAGPGSGAERKWSVDRDGAIKLIEAAKSNDIQRYVMISAMNLDQPRGSDVFQIYQKAKAEADNALRASGLDYTIVKPGRLTDEAGTGLVNLDRNLERGEIPRQDIAAITAEVLEDSDTIGLTFDALSGQTSIPDALKNLVENTPNT